ncbi:MAG: FKBP-type peptidyl-prolyl cis-trans isomerase, partial [Candidatus Poseidoniaceae archaeon]|nr:FKBP-type peptidyl-prolyl cis-trans isomerase [Candidatus Poseidoniaceae archaeon]
IADTSEEIEHPPIPIGLNEMTVPRTMMILSFVMVIMLIISSLLLVLAALDFQEELEDLFPKGTVSESDVQEDGSWSWEIDLLFDTCDSRLDDWDWPDSLSEQDDVFLYPGELRCDWEHQGAGDGASVVIYNRGNTTIDLILEIIGGSVEFKGEGSSNLLVNGLEGGDSVIIEISLTEDITEKDITITATHVEFQTSTINLDVHLFKGSNERQVHVTDGNNVQVHYILWDADTGEQLDEGDLSVTGGDDSRYIKGFGWAVIGLDIEEDRGFITDTGTTHTVLLPPPIAYGNSEGHELENTWLRFEVKIDRMII